MREVAHGSTGTAFDATLSGVVRRLRDGGEPVDEAELHREVGAAFARHHDRLRALVASELRGWPAEQVEDTVQDVLITAWRKLPEHQGGSFRAWLFGIATHTCANVRRKRREVLPGDDLWEPASEAASAYRALRRDEQARLLREAASRALGPREQEVVHLRYELDLPREEIARLLGLADPDEVRVILQRTRRALVRELTALLAELGLGPSLFADESRET